MNLKGITWDHTRGFTSIVAVSQRWHELHPEINITWEKRSLCEFSDMPVEDLAKKYDILIIDHPWAGFAVKHNILLYLEQYIDKSYLDDQNKYSVGKSHPSYNFDGHQSALAIDAAAPIAIYRPDIFQKASNDIPKTFEDVLLLAKKGCVIYSGLPLNLLMDFYMFAATSNTPLFISDNEFIDTPSGIEILETMKELSSYCDKNIFSLDPIQIHELLAESDSLSYSPFIYGYSNYSRRGYAAHLLKAAPSVTYKGSLLKTVLGGTGLAISNKSNHVNEAVAFSKYAASPEIQKTLYFEYGGQPGHRLAWTDTENNRQSLDFFAATLPTLDNSYLRPRYDGYITFQDSAGIYIHEYLQDGSSPYSVLEKMNHLYRISRGK